MQKVINCPCGFVVTADMRTHRVVAIALSSCVCALAVAGGVVMFAAAQSPRPRILVHVTHGPEHATRAALGFLVARTAIEEGHAVSLFLAGDAVHLLRDPILDTVTGVGTGSLTDADLKGKPAEMAPPARLLRLAIEHDRMFTY